MAQPDPDKIVADIDRKQNEEDLANLNKYIVDPAKAAYKKVKEGIMGTEAQNKYYEDKEKAKSVRKAKGGSVSSASKRGDGCAVKGKTKGKMV
jgi:alkylated DNA repair dioxygenase AlkB